MDLARLSVLHCHGVDPTSRCVLAAVWTVIEIFSVGSRRDVERPVWWILHAFPSFTAMVFSHLGDAFWAATFGRPWFGALLPVRESINIPILTAGSRA